MKPHPKNNHGSTYAQLEGTISRYYITDGVHVSATDSVGNVNKLRHKIFVIVNQLCVNYFLNSIDWTKSLFHDSLHLQPVRADVGGAEDIL